jgi:hypothetical protein
MRNIFKYVGVVCIPIYIIFTFISHLYNISINPLTNWLSDFGNPLINPSGALFYNAGCTIVAVLLIVFYIGMFQWYKNNKIERKYTISYICAQVSGIISSVFLVLASIYTLGTNTGLHSTFGMIHMIGIDCFMDFTAIAFFMNPEIEKWIGVFAFIAAIFNIVTTNAFSELYIAEWIYFLLFMIYMVIILLNHDKIVPHEIRNDKKNLESASKVSS